MRSDECESGKTGKPPPPCANFPTPPPGNGGRIIYPSGSIWQDPTSTRQRLFLSVGTTLKTQHLWKVDVLSDLPPLEIPQVQLRFPVIYCLAAPLAGRRAHHSTYVGSIGAD